MSDVATWRRGDVATSSLLLVQYSVSARCSAWARSPRINLGEVETVAFGAPR
jgi:hypothetical protein